MITLKDVAARAGVSVSTASNALSGTRAVSPDAVRAVLDAAAELGYRRNEVARSLRTGLRNSIALVVPDVTNPFWAGIVSSIESRAAERGWGVVLCNTEFDPAREATALARQMNAVDGIVLISTAPDAATLAPLHKLGIPIVVADERVELDGIGGVYSDNSAGGRLAAEHLISRGARRLGLLAGPPQLSTSRERVAGFLTGAAAAGIPSDEIVSVQASYSFDGGRAGARRLSSLRPDLDAVFACTDNQAMGAVFELEDLGRRVPDDVLVCGFDDISWARRTRPSLTTIHQDAVGLAERAFTMLYGMVADGAAGETVVLPVELIERESTGGAGR